MRQPSFLTVRSHDGRMSRVRKLGCLILVPLLLVLATFLIFSEKTLHHTYQLPLHLDASTFHSAPTLEQLGITPISPREYSYDTAALIAHLQIIATQLNTSPTTTHVTIENFLESSRTEGATGRQLDLPATIASIKTALETRQSTATLVLDDIPPEEITYTHTYVADNDPQIEALIQNYIDTHQGTYAVQLIELSGARRAVGINQDIRFTAASTYKLYVAFSAIRAVEDGRWQWTDPSYGGYTLEQCFELMITISSNECAEAIMRKYGAGNVTSDIQNLLGLSDQSGYNNGWGSTAFDLAKFLGLLETNQLPITAANRDRLLRHMKSNIWRDGIPAGIPTATVADKTGALWSLVHDAAIIYSPKGTYILIVMTDQSGWPSIATLAREIEAYR